MSGTRFTKQSGGAFIGVAALFACGVGTQAMAQQSEAEIAKKLNNPIADLISVPLQLNYAKDLGPTKDGESYVLNIQPVIPIHLNADFLTY